MDWLDLLAVQGTLKSLLQHHSSEASTFQLSAFFFSSATCKSLGFGLQLPCLKKFFYIAFLFISFFGCRAAYGNLVLPPGMEPAPPALAVQSLNHWFAREVLWCFFFFFFLILSRIKHRVKDSINLMHVITLPAPH